MSSIRMSVALAALTSALPVTSFAATALPASQFTDSVGVNLHLEFTNTYYYSKQPLVESLLKNAGIKHVRTRLLPADLAVSNPGPGTHTNAAALLNRAGVRTVLAGASQIRQLYLDTVDRQPRLTSDGWDDNFDAVWASADSAQAWWNKHGQGLTRIGGVEGVNEPNLRKGATCANWMSKAADFQYRMNERVASLPNLKNLNVLHVAPSLVHSSGSNSMCGDGPSKDPFRSLGRHAAPVGAGFTAAWNAGWATPAANAQPAAWFTATPGSVAATVEVGNLHYYPLANTTPENSLKAAFWVSGGVNKCGPPTSPNDPGPGATGFSCAEHVARARPDGGRKPVYATEAGYTVASGGVTERARGIYLPRMLLANLQAGIARTYIYELMQWTSTTPGDRYWLVSGGGASAATLGYNALVRLQQAIGNGDLPTASDLPSQVDLTVTEVAQPGWQIDPNAPVRHLLFAEKDGSLSLALWPTDVVTPTEADMPQRRVRINIGGVGKRISLHPIDPQSTVDIKAGQLIAASATQVEVVLTGGHAAVVKLR